MVEVLAIFGVLGWLLVIVTEWLSGLPFFPAILMGAIAIPLMAMHEYGVLGRRWRLRSWLLRPFPIPPERFHWMIERRRVRRAICWNAVAFAASWWNVVNLSAELTIDPFSMLGWANALTGTYTGARLLSSVVLFVRASQWFDAMSPNVVGLLRRTMYRLSDNYEYLGEQRRHPEREEVY